MNKPLYYMIFLAALLFGFSPKLQEDAVVKVREMFAANREINTLQYTFHKKERIDGSLVESKTNIKFQKKPHKIYLRELFPNDGLEVLFPHPADEGSALINPNGFPWFDVKLDPLGDIMREGQHHTVYALGYDYMISIIEFLFFKYKPQLGELTAWEGITLYDGNTCDIIVMESPKFEYLKYAASNGESISTIAKKYRLSEYLLHEKNPEIGNENLVAGEVISIPNDYAAKLVMFIDNKRKIPLKLEIYDEVGLFELYEFKDVEINPKFKENEFFETFPEYDFN